MAELEKQLAPASVFISRIKIEAKARELSNLWRCTSCLVCPSFHPRPPTGRRWKLESARGPRRDVVPWTSNKKKGRQVGKKKKKKRENRSSKRRHFCYQPSRAKWWKGHRTSAAACHSIERPTPAGKYLSTPHLSGSIFAPDSVVSAPFSLIIQIPAVNASNSLFQRLT